MVIVNRIMLPPWTLRLNEYNINHPQKAFFQPPSPTFDTDSADFTSERVAIIHADGTVHFGKVLKRQERRTPDTPSLPRLSGWDVSIDATVDNDQHIIEQWSCQQVINGMHNYSLHEEEDTNQDRFNGDWVAKYDRTNQCIAYGQVDASSEETNAEDEPFTVFRVTFHYGIIIDGDMRPYRKGVFEWHDSPAIHIMKLYLRKNPREDHPDLPKRTKKTKFLKAHGIQPPLPI